MRDWLKWNWPGLAIGLFGVVVISLAVAASISETNQKRLSSHGRGERCESFCTDKGGMAHISRDPGWGGPVYLCVCRDGTTVPL
jgi:putative hemolysin